MKIAIIGAGNVGAVLGKRFLDLGYSVRWGVSSPTNPRYQGMNVTDVSHAVQGTDVVFLAVPWPVAEAAVKSAGDMRGKVLIDLTNPIAPDFSGLLDLEGRSAAEHIAEWAQGSRVVKAFNTVGHNIMENPQFAQEAATLLIASDDDEAKMITRDLAAALGFDPIDAGSLKMARHLESFAWVWLTLAMKQDHGRDLVFQLLRR